MDMSAGWSAPRAPKGKGLRSALPRTAHGSAKTEPFTPPRLSCEFASVEWMLIAADAVGAPVDGPGKRKTNYEWVGGMEKIKMYGNKLSTRRCGTLGMHFSFRHPPPPRLVSSSKKKKKMGHISAKHVRVEKKCKKGDESAHPVEDRASGIQFVLGYDRAMLNVREKSVEDWMFSAG